MSERARILIVDDEPFNVDYLEQELEDLGYDTLTAANGQEAIEVVRRERPDLVLLDVMMPVMDGFTACRALKEDEETRLIPIVIMTALDSVDDRVRGIEAGADDFLTKPVDDRELVARIQTTLKLKRAVDRKLDDAGRLRDQFAKFVPEPLRRAAADDPSAAQLGEKVEQDVTVLMGDVSGFTRLSEQLPVDRLNTLVERYFGAFLDRIREGGGEINETTGDGFMAIFQGDDPVPHAVRAVETGLALLTIAAQLGRDSQDTALEFHLGAASGTALVGATRFAGTRGERWTFTASGPVTNLAKRLGDVAQAGQMVVGQETAGRVADQYRLESLGPQALKNLSEPVEAHLVLGPQ